MIQFVFLLVLTFSQISFANTEFLSLFENKKPVIAALMIEGDVLNTKKRTQLIAWGIEQIQIAKRQKMDGILFEFRGGKIGKPEITNEKFQAMKTIAQSLVQNGAPLVVGVEILWHYPKETLRLAKESGARFVRLDFFSDRVIADGSEVPINPKMIIDYKKKIGADSVALLTDIQVKYSKMVDAKVPLSKSASQALSFGSDGVIVTSTRSGKAPTAARVQNAKKGSLNKPVVIGSGFSFLNAPSLLPAADAIIVGTSISEKTGGPLVESKVSQLMGEVFKYRKQSR